MNEDLAEVIGVFIGDGCISEYDCHDRARRCIVMFTGHCKNDERYYMEKLAATVKKEFGYERKLYRRKDDHTIRYILVARRVVAFFKELGLPIGEKGNDIEIPQIIAENERFALACVRGIFNADGSVYRRYSKRYAGHARAYCSYAVIQFKMKNHKVVQQLKDILEKKGIRMNRIRRTGNCSVVRVTNQKSVKRFVETHGFTHQYHEKRYLEIVNGNEMASGVNYNFKGMPPKDNSNLGL